MTKKNTRKSATKPKRKSRSLALETCSPSVAVSFNINEYVRVKLTPRGKAIHRADHDAFNAQFPNAKSEYHAPEEDAEGWSKWQAWSLMQTFGPHISMGSEPPFETNIEFLANIVHEPQARQKTPDKSSL